MDSTQDQSSDTTFEANSNVERIPLREYIADNSSLFLVMGVFAALSVYVSSIPSGDVEEQFIQLGLVTSLLITGLLAVIILLSLSNQVSDEADVITSILHIKNIDTIVFLTLFGTLLYSLIHVISEDVEVLALISAVVLLVGTFAFILTTIMWVSSTLEPYIEESQLRTSVTATLLFVISRRIMARINEHLLEEYQLREFQFDAGVNFIDSLPAIIYLAFSLLVEIFRIIGSFVGVIALISLLSVAGKEYRQIKDNNGK